MGLREGSASSRRYEVLSALGEGGFGVVYEARDTRTGQRVALKELRDSSGQSIARFKQEFRSLSDVHHPNLVSLRELLEQDGSWLIVMELVPGTDFLDYVATSANDNAFAFDEGRLRGALAGMVEGLSALHGYGILHRDLKPSNVRVTPEGRAVLLDFGLATSIDPQRQSTHAMALGTVAYMAPEQAVGQRLGPEADLYALGVCLFEGLTGRVPIEGTTAVEVLLRKQREVAPRASSLSRSVPVDLDELCARLLSIDPSARPSAAEVLAQLGGGKRSVSPLPPPAESASSMAQPEEAFAGREGELLRLQRALSETHEGGLRIVLVEGDSGVGKSELVAEFVRRVRGADPTLLTLSGRCYENEQVSYKAFDGCVDELSRALGKLPRDECAALLPVRAAVLAQLFPVLKQVRAIAQAPREGISADPTARRLEAFEALARLLSKLAEERPLVLVVDDLQWADAESFRLLKALVEAPVPPPILLVATIRPRGELEPDVLAHVLEVRQWPVTSVVELMGLPEAEAWALARRLIGRTVPEAWLSAIVRESEGHPLFLAELVHFAGTRDLATRATLTLEQALCARVERLEPRARELLELVALAGRPYGSHVFARALAVPSVEDAARSLLSLKLLRLRKGQELSSYHDRIRHAVIALIAEARRPLLHRRLAEALAGVGEGDENEQARHWDLGGERELAIDAYQRAVTHAVAALAFVRAEQLCARAMELIESPADERLQELTIQRAHALASAGRSAEAAQLYERAADRAHGDLRMVLRSRAAQHLVLASNIGPGLAQVFDILRELGFRLPHRPLAALLRGTWEGLRLLLQKVSITQRQNSRTHFALRIVADLQFVLANVHPRSYLLLLLQSTRRAGASGSPVDRAYALAWRAWLRALFGASDSATPMLARAGKTIRELGDATEKAGHLFAEGSAHLAGFEWAKATASLEKAQHILQEQCPDRTWSLLSVRYHLGSTWYNLGEHARMIGEMERWIREARERRDFVSVGLLAGMGYGFARHLMVDAPQAAIDELTEAISPLPPQPYGFLQFGQVVGTTFAQLYGGGPEALRSLSRHVREHGRSFLLKTGAIRQALMMLRGLALLSAAVTAVDDERATFLRKARRIAHQLRRVRSPFARATGEMVLAQLEAGEGRSREALAHARVARDLFERLQHGNAQAARYLGGVLEGGEVGRAACAAVLSALSAQGWRAPRRQVVMLAPLLAELESTPARGGQRMLLCERYEVVDSLGRGGFGSVVSARDTRTGRMVALKELTQRDGVALERFKREFRTLQEVQHENLVQIESLFAHADRWYMAMELVEGDGLLGYVRADRRCDLERLRGSLLGLVDGLRALHEAGFVHRDVTPQNVRVTPEGRAVLIDFGLVARSGDAGERTGTGTPEHAAPEQLVGALPHPSADVYALGSCLYQALTGRPPFQAQVPAELLAIKRGAEAPALALPEAPELAACCTRMLAADPVHRPSLQQVRELVATIGASASARPSEAAGLAPGREEVTFSGREEELSMLAAAFDATCDDGLTVVLVEGESGLGKSALVEELARRAAAQSPRVRVLRSRCYENEQVALKAFDGAVDELARLLRSLPDPVCEALLPKRAALLSQLFPVLTSVAAIEHASKRGLPADPAARQLAARACFIELLRSLGAQLELLFVVDDLQWADGESLRLLGALLEQRRELPFMFVCTTRPPAEFEESATTEALSALRARAETTVLSLKGLSNADAERLACELFGGALPSVPLARIVEESKGHPLFLRELVEQERRGHGGTLRSLTLDAALRTRIESFEPEVRELLSLAALSGRPLGSQVYARALGLQTLPRTEVAGLLSNGMLGRRGEQELACYHDRIRTVVLGLLSATERRRLSERLARALDAEPSSEAAERARLWDEAGDAERAIQAYEQAGDRALQTLAFVRAEQHYARALALIGDARDERWRRLLVQRGHALVRAGRSAEAARSFQAASQGAQGEQAVRLRIWAAQHLIQSAQIEEGLSAAHALLREVGEPVAGDERVAFLQFAYESARVRLRGIEPKPPRASVSVEERLRLEALSGLAQPFGAVASLAALVLNLRYLRRALDIGDSTLTAGALAVGAMWRVVSDPTVDETALFERSRALADAAGDPGLRAHVESYWGLACMQNQMRAAPTHLMLAHELLQSRCPGQPWALTLARMNLSAAWAYLGDYGAVAREVGGWIDEARARDDRYAFAALTGFGTGWVRHVMNGRPEEGLEELECAMAPWPAAHFSLLHFGALGGYCGLRLAMRDAGLLRFLDAEAEVLRRALLMRTPTCQLTLHQHRFSAHLLTLDTLEAAPDSKVLARAAVEARAIARNRAQPASGIASLQRAVLARLRGQPERALAEVQQARNQLRASGHYFERGAAYFEGWLEGGAHGRELCASVLSTYEKEGFCQPRQGLALCLPGAHLFA